MAANLNNKRPFSGPDDDDDDFEEQGRVLCSFCKKSYSHGGNLRRHIKTCHAEKLSLKLQKIHTCTQCNQTYGKLRDLHEHKSNEHSKKTSKTPGHCPICNILIQTRSIIEHLQSCHDIFVQQEDLSFNTFDEFMTWKENLEKETNSKFIRKTSAKVYGLNKKYYFQCHRSGEFITTGSGKRHCKTQGSCKMNATCPASIHAIENDETKKVFVKYKKTHVGHRHDIGHLTLTKNERSEIASKIASKIPFEAILDSIRNSVSNSGQQRIHLVTTKDLANIERCHNLTAHYKRNIENDDLVMDVQSDDETDTIVQQLQTESISDSFQQRKKHAIDELYAAVNSITTEDELKVLLNVTKSIRPMLSSALANSFTSPISSTPSAVSGNKKISPQQRKFILKTRKKPKVTPIVKPSRDEANNIALQFIVKQT